MVGLIACPVHTYKDDFVQQPAILICFPSNTTLEAEFNAESSHLEIGTHVILSLGFSVKQSVSRTGGNGEEEGEGYLLAPPSRLLLKNESLSIRPFLLAMLDQIMMDPWQCMSKWFQNDDLNPFYTTNGTTIWDFVVQEPKLNQFINVAIASDARLVASVIVKHCYGDFQGLYSIVDVEGGTGTLAKAFPDINCIFLMFLMLLRVWTEWILHDWNDNECIRHNSKQGKWRETNHPRDGAEEPTSRCDIPPPPPPQTQTPIQQAPHTVSTIKLHILKKGEYDIWAMKIEHYLTHIDYPIWEVIQKGNGPVSVSTDTNGVIKVLPPKTTEEILAREKKRKTRTTLLMALQEDHLAKFHKMIDANKMWEAIKSRFGGNDESKKMQKYILKQQFEGFSVSNSEGLHKGYDRFQSLLSQLKIHGAGVSTEDANQKFLRSLPSAWSQVSLIMRTKPGVDSISFDDLYNNLRVFESDVKGSTASSSSTQNMAFVSENTSSTNEVSTAYGASSSSGHNPQREGSSSYTDELMYSFFANQSSSPQLDHKDLGQLDEFDLEAMDLKWQVAMISMRLKKFYKKTGRKLYFDAKEPVGFHKTKVECYNCHKTGHFARECRSKGNQDTRRRDAWNSGNKAKDSGRRSGKQEEPKALVALDGNGSDTEVTYCSKECKESYAKLKKLYDEQREQLGDASIEIQAYTQALKKMSARDKAWLGSSDREDSPVNDRYAEGMHDVPPSKTGIFIPSGPDVEINDSQFTYGQKQSKSSKYDFASCESNSSVETNESVPTPVANEPKPVSDPKVWSDAPIIEEYESDNDDEHASLPTKE
ncbi:ribonuclease H-like domain-containing protein [Tanacetum coccineum]